MKTLHTLQLSFYSAERHVIEVIMKEVGAIMPLCNNIKILMIEVEKDMVSYFKEFSRAFESMAYMRTGKLTIRIEH
jgi:hypothetical protein